MLGKTYLRLNNKEKAIAYLTRARDYAIASSEDLEVTFNALTFSTFYCLIKWFYIDVIGQTRGSQAIKFHQIGRWLQGCSRMFTHILSHKEKCMRLFCLPWNLIKNVCFLYYYIISLVCVLSVQCSSATVSKISPCVFTNTKFIHLFSIGPIGSVACHHRPKCAELESPPAIWRERTRRMCYLYVTVRRHCELLRKVLSLWTCLFDCVC